MTEYNQLLLSRQAEIESKIVSHVKHDPLIHFNRDLAVEAIERILDTRATLWITKATLHPSPSPDFDCVAFFVYSWIHNIYPLVRRELFAYARKKYTTFVELDENIEDDLDFEEDRMQTLFHDELKRANTEFLKKLKTTDQRVFWCMLQGLSDEEKSSHIFPDSNYTTKVRDKVRYMTNIVEFKYACFILSKKIYDRDRILQRINKAPKLVKRYFGVDRLDDVPSPEVANAIAFSDKEVETFKKPMGEWSPFSKIDFNGKEHKHTVVYSTPDGRMYDHVTKQVR